MPSTPTLAQVPTSSHVTLNAILALAGRLLIVILFLPDGIGKIFRFGAVVGMIGGKGLPFPEVVAIAVIGVEIAASIALLVGSQTRLAALALAGFSTAAAVLFHDFWAAPVNMAMFQQISFFKNVGLAGGLLVLAGAGPGTLSLDARRVMMANRSQG